MILGNFLDESLCPHYQPGFNTGAVYFIDDVRLINIPKPDGIPELMVDASIYPNPVSQLLTLELDKPVNGAVILADIQGREVKLRSLEGKKLVLDVSDLDAGVYVLNLNTDEGFLRRKVVVQH